MDHHLESILMNFANFIINDFAFYESSVSTPLTSNNHYLPLNIRSSVGIKVFYNCKELRGSLDVDLGHGTETGKIGENAFANCVNACGTFMSFRFTTFF